MDYSQGSWYTSLQINLKHFHYLGQSEMKCWVMDEEKLGAQLVHIASVNYPGAVELILQRGVFHNSQGKKMSHVICLSP